MAAKTLALPAIACVFALGLHAAFDVPSEPFFNGDETRHVMTGVMIHDAVRDGGWAHPRAYAERYYVQYPALGLIVWPPGFYVVEAAAMFAFGPTIAVAKGVLLAYLCLAVYYMFALANRTHGPTTAFFAVLLFVAGREVFAYSRNVMLEVPMTACVLAAVFHVERFLETARRRDLILAAVWTVAAGLHRYDAVLLAPAFFLRLLFDGRLKLLLTRPVIVAAAIAGVLLSPVYLLTLWEIGTTQARAGSGGGVSARVTYYPSLVWYQLGHLAFAAGACGLVAAVRGRSSRAFPYLALMAAAFLIFLPIDERETRHTIVALPAWCVFAAHAIAYPLRRYGFRWVTCLLFAAVIGQACYWALGRPAPSVTGYRAAAEYVRDHSAGPTPVLFDGLLDGTFVYETRTCDPGRRVWVLRGDKLFYATRSDPAAGYVEWVTPAEILKTIDAAGPAFLVFEDPPAKYDLPMQKLLRAAVAARPGRFVAVAEFPITNAEFAFLDGRRLVVYRDSEYVPGRPIEVRLKMLWQGRVFRGGSDEKAPADSGRGD